MERNLEEINDVLTLAKLNNEDLQPVHQTIYFTSESLSENDSILLQIDQNILNEVINEESKLYVKGNDEEDVVICSKTRTFHVNVAETSNSLLLVKNMCFFNDIKNSNHEALVKRVNVNGIFYDYLEAVEGKPHLMKLNVILEQSIYKGPEFEYELDKDKLVDIYDLRNIIQASDAEIDEALDLMNVVTIDGKVRLLDFEYHFRALSLMLKLLDENSWNLDEVDFDETVNALKDIVPEEVISSLLNKYTEESKVIDGLQLYQYKESTVCKFFAQVLLHGSGKFNLSEFLQAWRESVPEGMVPNEEMLYGIVIIDKNTKPNVIWEFDEKNLPEDINERFKTLFKIKDKWTIPEIAPYIKRLATNKMDVNAILAKYARASKIDGVKYYSSKHGK